MNDPHLSAMAGHNVTIFCHTNCHTQEVSQCSGRSAFKSPYQSWTSQNKCFALSCLPSIQFALIVKWMLYATARSYKKLKSWPFLPVGELGGNDLLKCSIVLEGWRWYFLVATERQLEAGFKYSHIHEEIISKLRRIVSPLTGYSWLHQRWRF